MSRGMVPRPRSGGWYPIQGRGGLPHPMSRGVSRPGMGYPPRPEVLRWGTPSPPQVWTDTQTGVKTLPSLVLRTRAVTIEIYQYNISCFVRFALVFQTSVDPSLAFIFTGAHLCYTSPAVSSSTKHKPIYFFKFSTYCC